MLFQRLNRTDAEKVFVIVKNVAGATITANYPVVWDISATIDGVNVSQPASASLSCFAGIADADMADQAYGLIQAYGYRVSARITNTTNVAIAAGDILIPVNGQWYLTYSGAADGKSGFVTAGEAFTTSSAPAAVNKKVLIKAL